MLCGQRLEVEAGWHGLGRPFISEVGQQEVALQASSLALHRVLWTPGAQAAESEKRGRDLENLLVQDLLSTVEGCPQVLGLLKAQCDEETALLIAIQGLCGHSALQGIETAGPQLCCERRGR